MISLENPFLLTPASRYTVEMVLAGHPDKICDQISDTILDGYLSADPRSRVGVECMGSGDTLIIAGEVNSSVSLDVASLGRSVWREIGYAGELQVINLLGIQSEQLGNVVAAGGAGDQAIVYGFACDNGDNYLPFGVQLVSKLARDIDAFRKKSNAYLPDGKLQVTVDHGVVESLVISVQHRTDADLNALEQTVVKEVASPLLTQENPPRIYFNNRSQFVNGGFANDTGLSGRKLAVDTYGGLVPHGGGALSGKDPSKVDRAAAYMARHVAKSIVANQVAKSCLVAVAYIFGNEHPVMLDVRIDDDSASKKVLDLIRTRFDFRPQAIEERLSLRQQKYRPTSIYGHFSNPNFTWESVSAL